MPFDRGATIMNGEQASKRQAAVWAQEQFSQWASLVQNALVWRKGWQEEGVDHAATFPDTVRFIHFATDRIASVEQIS